MLKEKRSEKLTEAVIEEAADWFVRMNNQPVSNAVQRSFNAWCEQSAQHKLAYQRTADLWGELKAPALEAAKTGWHRRYATRNSSFGKFIKWSTVAASLVAAISCGALWRDAGLFQRHISDYAAAPGQQLEITLRDGSRVYLDGDSALNEYFTDQERKVELVRGRAWFDVVRNENRPFKVAGGLANIQVLGTAFAVELEQDLTKVTVERGLVAVYGHDASHGINLPAGNSAAVSKDKIEQVDGDDAEARLAWRRGLIMMNQTPLKSVLHELSRYSSGRIVLNDPDLENLPVSGVFQANNPDAVFDALRNTLNLSVVHVPGLLTIISR
ncbi:FecR family protein [Paenochrobactrum pullorum]|uniref:FecR family protein n=1 Tax=Paenochrobactrum pullorum TaxID=1324351 RepID=UPI0035BC7E42